MRVKNRIILSVALLCTAVARAQPYCIASSFPQQFFNNNGQPNAGGFVVSCVAGSTCNYPVPGSPQPTWTDSSAFTTNADPIPLNTAGFPTSGGIWLNSTLFYKLVLVDSTGAIIKTTDNISCASGGGGGGPTTNYWTLSGTTIMNNNGAGAGTVAVGSDLDIGGNAVVMGQIQLQSNTSFNAALRATNGMTASALWNWPAMDAAGCLTSDGSGNLTFTACSGGGGGGSPGGLTTNVQYNNGGVFGGSANFTWNNGGQLLTVTAANSSSAGIAIAAGFGQADSGFIATSGTCNNFNCIQAPTGGVYGRSITALKYIQSGSSSGAPTTTTGDTFNPGALYWDTGSLSEQVWNGASWVSLGGGSGSPGGSDTNIQYNSTGSFAGSTNFTWNNTTRLLTVTSASAGVAGVAVATGFIQADAGFLATLGTATNYDSIQAPGGGMHAKSFTANSYVQTGNSSGIPTATTGDAFHFGAMYYDTGLAAEQLCTLATCSGTGWVSLGIGGAGTPNGPTSSLQYNNGGIFGGSANLEWNNVTRLLTITPAASTVGLVVSGGYAQADSGFLATGGTCTVYNCIQAPGGGQAAKSFTATNYVQSGSSNGIPSATSGDAFHAGALYFDTGLSVERVCTLGTCSGTGWVSLATGGVSSINSLTGALNISNNGQPNAVSVTPSGTNIFLTLPQSIGTGSAVTFGSVATSGAMTANGVIASTSGGVQVTGTSLDNSIQTTGGFLATRGFAAQLNAANSIQTVGGFNAGDTGGGNGVYQINGSTIINNAGQFVGAAVLATGNVQTGGTFAVVGGFFGQTHNVVIGGCTIFFSGGIAYAFSGC